MTIPNVDDETPKSKGGRKKKRSIINNLKPRKLNFSDNTIPTSSTVTHNPNDIVNPNNDIIVNPQNDVSGPNDN